MLQIKNLNISLIKDLRTILEDFSFTLNDGDKAVIIGEEGNGKSTLLKLIYDPDMISGYAEFSGEIVKHNTCFGYLSQEMSLREKEMSVYEYCCEIEDFFDISPKEMSRVANQLALDKNIYYSDRIIGTLSGGERVKLQLSKILFENPDVLLLDEPSNDIDIETLTWLERFINNCGMPVLFISHDEVLIENTANVIIHIEQVRRKTVSRYTVAKMPYRQYVTQRARGLEHQEQVARKERDELKAKQERLRQIEQKVASDMKSISRADPHGGQLLKKKMKSVKSMEKRFDKEAETMTQIPDVEDAIMIRFDQKISIPNGKTIIELDLHELSVAGRVLAEDIFLNVTGPEKICIIGKNGQGKTTLIRLIADILLSRNDIKCAYMPQNYEEVLALSETPPEFLALSAHKDHITQARTYLGSVKFTPEEMEHPCSDLSGGQKAKLLLLKMILDGCNVLILDEPTRNFSPLSTPVIRSVLKSFGGAIISVSHDRKFINEVCDKVYELTENGLSLKTEVI